MIDFDDNFFTLMDDSGDTREDLKHTEQCGQNLDELRKLLEDADKLEQTIYVSIN